MSPTPSHLALQIAACLRGYRFKSARSEFDLHAGMDVALTANGIPFTREVVLSPKDRIDFLVDSIGVEVKIRANKNDLLRQLARYSECDQLTELVFVTTSARLAAQVPPSLGGKAILTVHLPLGFT